MYQGFVSREVVERLDCILCVNEDIIKKNCTINYNKFNVHDGQHIMVKCQAMVMIILMTYVTLKFVDSRTTDFALSKKYSRRKPPYSWIGSNALARSALVERQERLQYNCEEMMMTGQIDNNRSLIPDDFRNILVDDELELLYCYVPKVACTNWKRVLMIATGKWSGNDPLEIPANLTHAQSTFQRLSNFTMPDIEQRLASYDALIVVRHPFERLLSAFRNKLETRDEKGSKYFQTRFGRKIIKKYRRNATEESLIRGHDVRFGEFVDFITNKESNETANEHWQSMYELCLPCNVNYNLVSKYETLTEDATEVLERIDAGFIPFPSRPLNHELTAQKLEHYYSSLTLKQLRKLTDLYQLDLRLFDYSLEEVLGFSLG